MKVLSVVGARPNFMKIAPLAVEFERAGVTHILVHTGQHYDVNLSDIFFTDLGLKQPDVHLGVGSGSHAEQTARVMLAFEPVVKLHNPDVVVVVGDVNSTLAASLVAAKLGIPLAHVEAGLRSFDRSMPEEINRLLTDQLSDFLFTPSPDADDNLRREGIADERIFRVGNIMIDALMQIQFKAEKSDIHERLGVARNEYALLTLHRAGNVDDPDRLASILEGVYKVCSLLPVVFPVHPRTRSRMQEFGFWNVAETHERLLMVEPLGYADFSALLKHARFVLTDSGGVQEETTFYGVPCLTLRENTERPITVTVGTNEVVGANPERIYRRAQAAFEGKWKRGKVPEMWDGNTARRITELLIQALG